MDAELCLVARTQPPGTTLKSYFADSGAHPTMLSVAVGYQASLQRTQLTGSTYPHAGVIATSPTTAPDAAPMDVGRPLNQPSSPAVTTSRKPHVIIAIAAARWVFTSARPARSPELIAEPALKLQVDVPGVDRTHANASHNDASGRPLHALQRTRACPSTHPNHPNQSRAAPSRM